jgi:4-hydroxyphenylacetate 3-monooxygenase
MSMATSTSSEENRLTALNRAHAADLTAELKDPVNTCMAEYDLHGWTVPDLINPDDVSWLPKR